MSPFFTKKMQEKPRKGHSGWHQIIKNELQLTNCYSKIPLKVHFPLLAEEKPPFCQFTRHTFHGTRKGSFEQISAQGVHLKRDARVLFTHPPPSCRALPPPHDSPRKSEYILMVKGTNSQTCSLSRAGSP